MYLPDVDHIVCRSVLITYRAVVVDVCDCERSVMQWFILALIGISFDQNALSDFIAMLDSFRIFAFVVFVDQFLFSLLDFFPIGCVFDVEYLSLIHI